ncbi:MULTISPECIES: hypothetical protein [unclassified Crossiella]|uniref:hypothetical protein n=1 Tax=unclassified Crossiella TaxID=2620835 RepID=UPI0020000AAD|nr:MULTISPECIES: hypothetical protein [unclassified Crossiella]MCK2238183.1 hypothetical protein [Crossiella sp. S99.2]MCK2256223.1 hypothetical protein [Crossiella sp. S99.1]
MSKSRRARTRAVRQRMSESGASYARAAREVGDPRQQPALSRTDLVRAHIRALLSGQGQDTQQRDAEIQALEARGHRIVDGGQTGPDSWEILDWRTGEQLAHGDDGLEGYDATTDRLDPDGTWIHIDQIESEPGPRPVTAGIPDSLSEVLDDWISLQSTPDEEIADFIGWSVDRVRDHR